MRYVKDRAYFMKSTLKFGNDEKYFGSKILALNAQG